jgi:hypothetical protein
MLSEDNVYPLLLLSFKCWEMAKQVSFSDLKHHLNAEAQVIVILAHHAFPFPFMSSLYLFLVNLTTLSISEFILGQILG